MVYTGRSNDCPGAGTTASRPYVERSSFEPDMLFNLVGADERWPTAERLLHDVARCIPAVLDGKPPPSATPTPGLIASLGMGAEGELLLFQVRQRKRAT